MKARGARPGARKTRNLAAAVLGFAALAAAAAAVAPLVWDVDRDRPALIAAAARLFGGEAAVGRLRLSLWGRPRIEIAGFRFKDAAGNTVLAAESAELGLESLLSGSPELVLTVERARLAPGGILGALAAREPVAELPRWAAWARWGVRLRDAAVDAPHVSGLRLRADQAPGERAFRVEAEAELGLPVGAGRLSGPARLVARFEPALSGDRLEAAALSAELDLGGVDAAVGEAFHKRAGIPASVSLSARVSPRETVLDRLVLRLTDAELRASGTVTNLGEPGSAGAPPLVKLSAVSNEADARPLAALFPWLSGVTVSGQARVEADVAGLSSALSYRARLAARELRFSAPALKAAPSVDVDASVEDGALKELRLVAKTPAAGGAQLTGQPGKFVLASDGLDLDSLVDWTRLGPVALGWLHATGSARLELKNLKAGGATAERLEGRLYLDRSTAGVEGLELTLWNGKIRGGLAVARETRAYTFGVLVDGVDLRQAEALPAVASALHGAHGGRLYLEANGSGQGFEAESARARLKIDGAVKIDDAVLSVLDQPVHYRWASSHFTVEGGKVRLPDFATRSAPAGSRGGSQAAMDLRGIAEVALKEETVSGTIAVVPTGPLGENNPVKFKLRLGCTWRQPCYLSEGSPSHE